MKTKRGWLGVVLLGLVVPLAPGEAISQEGRLPRAEEIALAESAAPAHVSREATIYVQAADGYELARQGSNGYSCLVLRFFPTSLEPICLDSEGTAAILPRYLDEGQMQAQGMSREEIQQKVAEGFATGRYRAPQRAVVSYMLSCRNRVPVDPDGKQIVPYRPHIMFYIPYLTNEQMGANFEDHWMPFVADEGSPHAIVIVPVGEDPDAPRCGTE